MTDITFHGHSAVSLRSGAGQHLFIDPGTFSDLTGLSDADAILITHAHADHIAPGALAGTDAEVWATAEVVGQLADEGVRGSRLHAVAPGQRFRAAGHEVEALGGLHAEIHSSIPRIANNAYLIEGTVLHPGDSLPAVPDPGSVGLLLLPVSAPWLKLAESIDFARGFADARIAPIHDAILSDAGKGLVDSLLTRMLPAGAYGRVESGQTLSV